MTITTTTTTTTANAIAVSDDEDDDNINDKKSFQVHDYFNKDLIDRYDGFILDQFGVLHNGLNGLDGAPELVKVLVNKYNKKLVILSNSSSSSESCKGKLPDLGFNQNYFVNAVTSGEEAGRYIRNEYGGAAVKNNATATTTKKKALWFTWKYRKTTPSSLRFLELCGNVSVTTDPDEADYIILQGVEVLRGQGDNDGAAEEISLGNFHTSGKMDENHDDDDHVTIDSVLRTCVGRNIPMICANPDYIMVKPNGSIGYMPGTISKRYEELGGDCISFGKPHVPHFEACLQYLNLSKDKVAHVGDSLHHDVKGANDSGIDSIFVAGGIHRTELLGGCELGDVPGKNDLKKLFKKHSQIPTHVVPMFRGEIK
jgi:HAD superfamily hydrolase (TIGR01450 family)